MWTPLLRATSRTPLMVWGRPFLSRSAFKNFMTLGSMVGMSSILLSATPWSNIMAPPSRTSNAWRATVSSSKVASMSTVLTCDLRNRLPNLT